MEFFIRSHRDVHGRVLSTPFFRLLPSEFKDVLVGVIFLAGAIFVLIVINLFFKIIEDIGL